MANEDCDKWVLACWHAPWHHVQLFFVCAVQGRPAWDWGPTGDGGKAYGWNSYHAAKKFQREHESDLEGYFPCNLSELRRDWIRRNNL